MDNQAKKRKLAVKASFGTGKDTVFDESVRKVWQIHTI